MNNYNGTLVDASPSLLKEKTSTFYINSETLYGVNYYCEYDDLTFEKQIDQKEAFLCMTEKYAKANGYTLLTETNIYGGVV